MATEKVVKEDAVQERKDINELLDISPPESEEEKKEEEGEEEQEEQEEEEDKEEDQKEEEEKEKKDEEDKEDDPLLKKLGELSEQVSSLEKPQEFKKEESKEEKEEEKGEEDSSMTEIKALLQPVDEKEVDYINVETFKGSFDEKEVSAMNKVLNSIVKKARVEARQVALQDAMKVFPKMIDFKVEGHLAAQEFWSRNQGLSKLCEKYPKVELFVKNTATTIQKGNPEMGLKAVYKQTEKEVKELLKERLEKYEPKPEELKDKRKPAFPSKPAHGRKTPVKKVSKPTSEQEEIKELMDLGF